MSYGGRLILINSVLTSLPMFLLLFFEVPVGVRKRLDFYRSRFFWQGDELKKNIGLLNGISSVDRKTKEVSVLRILKLRTDVFSASGCLSYL